MAETTTKSPVGTGGKSLRIAEKITVSKVALRKIFPHNLQIKKSFSSCFFLLVSSNTNYSLTTNCDCCSDISSSFKECVTHAQLVWFVVVTQLVGLYLVSQYCIKKQTILKLT